MKKYIIFITMFFILSFSCYASWLYPFMTTYDGSGFYCSFDNFTTEGSGTDVDEFYGCSWLGDAMSRNDTISVNIYNVNSLNISDTSYSESQEFAPYVNDSISNHYASLGGTNVFYNAGGFIGGTLGIYNRFPYISSTDNNISFCVTPNDDYYVSMWLMYNKTDITESEFFKIQNLDIINSTPEFYDSMIVSIKNDILYYNFTDVDGVTNILGESSNKLNNKTRYHILISYDHVTDIASLYIDNILNSSESSSGIDMCFDGNSPYIRYGFKGGGSLQIPRYIDEFILSSGTITDSDRTKLYEVSHRSSLIYNVSDVDIVVINNSESFSFDYNFTDAIDNITYYENSSYSSINSDGVFTFISSINGTYNIRVNGTDGYDNWVYDDFVILNGDVSTPKSDIELFAESLEKNNRESIDSYVYVFMFALIVGLFILILLYRIAILKPLLILIMFVYSIMLGQRYEALFGFMMLLISCALSLIVYYL